jgi:hypothetical protein
MQMNLVADSSEPAECRAGDIYQQAERANFDHRRINTTAIEYTF